MLSWHLFNGHSLQDNPRKPVPSVSILDSVGAKDVGDGGDNWSYETRKAPVKSSPPTNQHPVFLQAGCPSYRPTDSVKAVKGNRYHAAFKWFLAQYSETEDIAYPFKDPRSCSFDKLLRR